jgi:hypothetical protein
MKVTVTNEPSLKIIKTETKSIVNVEISEFGQITPKPDNTNIVEVPNEIGLKITVQQ